MNAENLSRLFEEPAPESSIRTANPACPGPRSCHDIVSGMILGDKYAVERRLGEGAMGVVFAARHLGLDETVDPAWADRELPLALPVQGNLDPLALIAGGEALRTAAKRILDAFPSRPHIFNLGHGIQQTTPIAHVEQLVQLVKG